MALNKLKKNQLKAEFNIRQNFHNNYYITTI